MEEAVYIALLAKGYPGLFHTAEMNAYTFIRDELPLAQGNALIHASRILEGRVMIWPQLQFSRLGRWWQRVRALFRRRRTESGMTNKELAD